MNKEDLININGIREDLYQAMQIGDITLSSKHSQELYDFMNYQDREIERLNNIINKLKWKPIEEYDKSNYDWVLVKYFDGDYECVPCVAEKRFGKWYSIDEKEIQFDVKYFMDMQQLDKLQELKGSNEPSFEEMVGFVENVYKDIKSQSTLHEELEEERKTIAKIVGDFEEVNK